MKRRCDRLIRQLARSGDRTERMRAVVDLLWDTLHPTGVSWVGFYVHEGHEELVLGPCRDKPACSPIGLHGVCGRAFRERRPIVVQDVAALGENYIPCDPRDRSELAVPLLNADGTCWGVLDLDSHDPGCFTDNDAANLHALLRVVGLTV